MQEDFEVRKKNSSNCKTVRSEKGTVALHLLQIEPNTFFVMFDFKDKTFKCMKSLSMIIGAWPDAPVLYSKFIQFVITYYYIFGRTIMQVTIIIKITKNKENKIHIRSC